MSLVETFDPPTMAPTGALGVAMAFSRAFSSLAKRGPAQAIGANFATP